MVPNSLCQVNKAVIAVPAKFSPQQRIATGEAYKAAGLKVRVSNRQQMPLHFNNTIYYFVHYILHTLLWDVHR
jgi:hypothetical protein